VEGIVSPVRDVNSVSASARKTIQRSGSDNCLMWLLKTETGKNVRRRLPGIITRSISEHQISKTIPRCPFEIEIAKVSWFRLRSKPCRHGVYVQDIGTTNFSELTLYVVLFPDKHIQEFLVVLPLYLDRPALSSPSAVDGESVENMLTSATTP